MIWVALLLIALPAISGCGPNIKIFVSSDIENYHLERIAVMPFIEDDRKIEEGSLKSQTIEKGAGDKLTQIFYETLKTKDQIQLIPMEDVARVAKEIADKEGDLPIKNIALKAGKELKADGVILGSVTSFQERVGGSFGIERPASVGFEVELFSVQDDKLLWKSGFYETQASLTEDIGSLPLFIRRGGKWITAEELARYGVEEVIKDYPAVKR